MKLAILRVRGAHRVDSDVINTLKLLNLNKRNHCVVVSDSPHIRGMLKKISGYATWGKVSAEVEAKLKKFANGSHFALNSPKTGHERKGVKVQFGAGGSLGGRDDLGELLLRMM